MRKICSVLLLVSLLAVCACDNFMISGALNPSTFAGTVSIVRLTITNDGTQITFVTLINGTDSRDFRFCGDVVNQFPMSSAVQGSFTPGTVCGNVVRVTIRG